MQKHSIRKPWKRWQWLADLHLTLRFLGHVPPEQQCRIRDAMRRLDCMPLDLQMQGVGSFPGEVLWAAIAPSERLTQLKLLIDKRLAEAGMPPEGKDFVPHVTLARMHKTPRSVEASFLAQQRTFELAPWTVSCLSLFDSQRNRQGPVYRVLERYALGRGQE